MHKSEAPHHNIAETESAALRPGGRAPPIRPSPVPPAFWAFARSPRTDDNEDDSDRPGTLLPLNAGPDALRWGPADGRPLGEAGGGGGAAQPVGVAVAPNGIALVTDCGGRGVRALDVDGHQGAALRRAQAAGAGLGAGACAGVAVSSRGYLVVLAKPRSRCVSAHARDGRRLFCLQLGWRRPFGVAFTARGRVAVSDCCESGTLSVLTVDWTSGGVLHLQRIRGLRRPSFLACGEDGAIAVSTRGSVHLYDGAGTLVWKSGPDRGVFRPAGVAFDSERNVVVADRGSGRVVVLLGRDGGLLRCVVRGLAGPQGLALSPSGVLVIADREAEALITHAYQPVHTPPQPPAFIH
ncbi:hypothetical protein AAFF_G00012150 [Aldrovandia affinis]|uniref:NHL repeat-containing protein n=1 Tax=Aldrovandia affinis TaxID=143900 RepID=A0AAD7S714_9TELE|nr:hypothetical protein AAFF_G00012150 [Aldrovandia affinis]